MYFDARITADGGGCRVEVRGQGMKLQGRDMYRVWLELTCFRFSDSYICKGFTQKPFMSCRRESVDHGGQKCPAGRSMLVSLVNILRASELMRGAGHAPCSSVVAFFRRGQRVWILEGPEIRRLTQIGKRQGLVWRASSYLNVKYLTFYYLRGFVWVQVAVFLR